MYNELIKRIKEFDTIVIVRHIGVDPDALCSQLALRDSIKLTYPNKQVFAIGTGSSKFVHMGKLDKIEKEKLEKSEEKKEQIKEEKEKEEEENAECETCANRKYQDGSDEMVSFKSASHISPESAATRVRAHEQEHVNNAYEKAELKEGKVQFASIAIHTSI